MADLLALELPAVLDEIAGGQRGLNRRQPRLDVGHDAAQVAAGRVALHDDPPPDVLAVDRVRAAALADLGHGVERNAAAARQGQRQPAQACRDLGGTGRRAARADRTSAAPARFPRRRGRSWPFRRTRSRRRTSGRSCASSCPVELDLQLRNLDLLLDQQVLHARHVGDGGFHFVRPWCAASSSRRRRA